MTSLPAASGHRASGGHGDEYFYSPLPKLGTIRLLRLMPHQDMDAPLQCELFEYPLRKARQGLHMYEALSYVWGSEEDQKPIYIRADDKMDDSSPSPPPGNSRRLLVTANLHAALSHLRDELLERIMWIDAICINQKDSVEKGRQVQFMAEIYASANCVVVWLGEASSESGQVFETLRKAARGQYTDQSIDEPTQQAIFTLLERPWFKRIWVVQEAAAAQHILMRCGLDEVDGFALCSGLSALNLSYTDHPDLQGLIPPITYLIRDAVFRSRYGRNQPEPSQPGTFSLNIHSLGELMDMYHVRKATNLLDRIYALLGMSSDDPQMAGLSVDYSLPWGVVFQKLIQFLLSDQVVVDTWDDCAVAVIQGKGYVCGWVYAVDLDETRGDVQHIAISWKDAYGHFNLSSSDASRHTLRASAQPIRVGDAVCFLQGAPKPTIVRFLKAYSAIIMITAPLKETMEQIRKTYETRDEKWLRLLSYIPASPTDCVMIWDWDAPQHNLHDRGYEYFISSRGPPRPWTESQDHFIKATRWWNFGLLLNRFETYKDAWLYFQNAVEAYATALASTATSPDYSAWTAADEEARMALKDLVIGEKSALTEAEGFDNCTPPLFWAVEKEHEGLVEVLLYKGAPREAETSTDFTPLFCAMDKGNERIVQLLLDNGAILHTQTSDHQPRLVWAVEEGYEGAVRWLLFNDDENLDLDGIHYHAQDALLAATLAGYDEIVRIILEHGARVDGFRSSNPLRIAARENHEKVVQILLENGADVNAGVGQYGHALQAAASGGHEKIVQILLEKGADVNAHGGHVEGDALLAASEKGHDKIVQILLERGADVNAQFGRHHRNALLAASSNGYDKIVEMLLEKGADVNTRSVENGTALRAACWTGNKKIVQILLERGADVNAPAGADGRALYAASQKGEKKIVQILLERGADVNAQGGEYGNALQAASAEGHEEIVQMLLKQGVNVNAQGGRHGNALYAASCRGYKKIVQMLLEGGADESDECRIQVEYDSSF